MLALPKPMEFQVWQDVVEIERKAEMKYVTSVERLAIERGVMQGELAGLSKGKAELILRLLTRRFGTPPDWVAPRLQAATPDQLDTWFERALDATTLAEVFGGH